MILDFLYEHEMLSRIESQIKCIIFFLYDISRFLNVSFLLFLSLFPQKKVGYHPPTTTKINNKLSFDIVPTAGVHYV